MPEDQSIYRVLNRDGKRVRVFGRRNLSGWLGRWYPGERKRLAQHYRIQRATAVIWEDVTEEFLHD